MEAYETLVLKAILLDFGDTLVKLGSEAVYEECFEKLYRSLSSRGVTLSKVGFRSTFSRVRQRRREEVEETCREVSFRSILSEALAELGYRGMATGSMVSELAEAYMEPFIEAIEMDSYIPQLLERLEASYSLGLVSNASHAAAVRKALERFDLTRFFGTVIISEEVGWRKPSLEIFQAALRALSIEASEALFVGDTPAYDIRGAMRAGIKAVLVSRSAPSEASTEGEPYPVIQDLRELIPFLEGRYGSRFGEGPT